MYIRRMLKKRLFISIASVVILLLVFVGSTYALFFSVQSNEEDQHLSVGDLNVVFNGGSAINIPNISPMPDANAISRNDNIYTFTIHNTGNLAWHYSISLRDNPAFLPGGTSFSASRNLLPHQFIKYSFDNGSSSILGNAPNGLIFEGIINPGDTRTFTVRLWVGEAQTYNLPNSALGSEIHLNIIVTGRAGAEEPTTTIADTILKANGGKEAICNKLRPNFTNPATTDEGMFCEPDDEGLSYYFRGTHTLNNNVIFAGFQWKIVRIDGNDNIRMIYNGVCPNNECTINQTHADTELGATSILRTGTTYTHAWNTNYTNDNKYVGFMYGGANGVASTCRNGTGCATDNETSSNAKAQLDLWYQNNILNQGSTITSKIADVAFCNDRRLRSEVGGSATGTGFGSSVTDYAIRQRNTNPSLLCPITNDRFTVSSANGNGALTYPVGLITTDEVRLAGGADVINELYYLITGQWYRTMSPGSFGGSSALVRVVGASGNLLDSLDVGRSVVGALGLRPFIALNSNTVIVSGDGSATNPYRIQ